MRSKKNKNLWLVILGILLATGLISAQTQFNLNFNPEINISGDFVSSYVWRGFKQAGASIQPELSLSLEDFTIGAWGSTDIDGKDKKEVDFYASYDIDRFQFKATDYWWDGEGAHRYFSYPDDEFSGHILELSATYTLSKKFPLSVNWNTFILGKGNKKNDGGNSFSTYIELAYPLRVNDVDITLATGFIPWKSTVYGPEMDGFKFTNIQIGASKTIKISETFSVPIYVNILSNPAQEDIHLIFGITLR